MQAHCKGVISSEKSWRRWRWSQRRVVRIQNHLLYNKGGTSWCFFVDIHTLSVVYFWTMCSCLCNILNHCTFWPVILLYCLNIHLASLLLPIVFVQQCHKRTVFQKNERNRSMNVKENKMNSEHICVFACTLVVGTSEGKLELKYVHFSYKYFQRKGVYNNN